VLIYIPQIITSSSLTSIAISIGILDAMRGVCSASITILAAAIAELAWLLTRKTRAGSHPLRLLFASTATPSRL
jgi:hypothetical protein